MKKKSKKMKFWLMPMAILAIIVLFIAGKNLSNNTAKNESDAFSFIMFGDTRTEVFIPYGKDSIEYINKVLAARYLGNDPKTFFSEGGILDSIQLYKDGKLSEVQFYNQQKWPQEIYTVSEGKRRRKQCKEGLDWVYDNIAKELTTKDADFVIHGGDIVLFGYQGYTFNESPYWQFFNKSFYSKLPDESLYPVIGNHETWYDTLVVGFSQGFPYLGDYGFSEKNRIYSKDYHNSRFVYLYSGTYDPETVWNSKEPDFTAQMKYLRDQLNDAVDKNIKSVFVTYHFPSFVKVGHPPLPPDQNPHYQVLKDFSDKLKIFVFNSHTHTTEYYIVDNIHYMVMGAGGAPQKFKEVEGGSTEPELYWKGKPRFEEYNYIKVTVEDNKVAGKIHRFIPPNKYEWVDLFEIDI